MRLRVIEQQDEYGIHYTPQYFEERRGWCECYLDCNLSHEIYRIIYRKPEDAIAVCEAYADKFTEKVVWSKDTEKLED